MSHYINISKALIFDLDEIVAIAKTENNSTLEPRQFTITITSKRGQIFPVYYTDVTMRNNMYDSLWEIIRKRHVEEPVDFEEQEHTFDADENPTDSME